MTINHTGSENRIVNVQFVGDSGIQLAISSLTVNGVPGISPNCGTGCFSFTIGTGGYNSVIGVTPGVGTTQVGYATVTILAPASSTTSSLLVTVDMSFTFGGSVTEEPALSNPVTSFSSPFTETIRSSNGIELINPQTTTVNVTITQYDDAEPPSQISVPKTINMAPGGRNAEFLNQLFSPVVSSGSIKVASTAPIFIWPIRIDIDEQNNLHFVFPNVPDHRTPAEKTVDLVAQVQELINVELNSGQANGLEQPLNNALRSIGKGKIQAACSQLLGFVNQVTGKTPPLSQQTSDELIGQANNIRASIGCTE